MKVDSFLVPNCGWDLTNGYLCEELTTVDHRSPRVLWVGRISEQKRFEWLLDIAERCPDIAFDVVGAASAESDYSSTLIQRATGVPNVKMHGWVPYAEMTWYYRNCHILCCTSAYEGFPNTFLEAWALGIPVISMSLFLRYDFSIHYFADVLSR